ncbi:hypothetical protein DFH06DRAFT_1208419 [Mycena polygramma]|nr:hypothetical protein DFH06DRAFT_1208419 [Mycena polygramma]
MFLRKLFHRPTAIMTSEHTSSPRPGTRNLDPVAPDTDELRERLSQVDVEIEELQSRLDRLADTRASILDTLNLIVYPILTLPPEITSEIFLQYVADCPLHLPGSYIKLNGPPLLATVCRAWRHVALNTQAIWSDITTQRSATDTILQCCLARTGGHSLVLNTALQGENRERKFAVLAPSSPQWQSFECRLRLPVDFAIDEIRGRTPLLRKLAVVAYGKTAQTPITAFSVAPQLREVELHEVSMAEISLPWAQITYAKVWDNKPTEIADMLRQMPLLEKLVLTRSHSFDTPSSPVQLVHLHTLEIRNPDYLNVLDHVTLPALKNLTLEECDNSLPIVLRFLARSGCELHSISLTRFWVPFVCDFLAAVPTVTDVRLDSAYEWWSEEDLIPFFQDLTPSADFLPRLETLSMPWGIPTVPVEVVVMLESRWSQSGDKSNRLKSFKLRCRAEALKKRGQLVVGSDVRTRLHALVADGLEIEIPGV